MRKLPNTFIAITKSVFIGWLVFFACIIQAWGQGNPAAILRAAENQPAATETASQPTPSIPIPIADIAVQAESALLSIRRLRSESAAMPIAELAKDDLPALNRAVSTRLGEMRRLLIQNASLNVIRDLESEWKELDERAGAVTTDLTTMALELDQDLAALEKLQAQWQASHELAVNENAPAAILSRIKEITEALEKAKKRMLERRAAILSLQGEAASLSSRTSQARQTLNEASERATARLMYRDSPPLWSEAFWTAWIGDVAEEENGNLPGQATVFSTYLKYQQRSFILHIIIFAGLAGLMFLARRWIEPERKINQGLKRATVIFDMPLVSAALLALLASTWIYPRPPRTLWLVLSVIAVVPVTVLARRLTVPYLHPMLYALACFYLADKLRAFIAVLPVLSRVMLLAELLLFMAFIIWAIRLLKKARQGMAHRLPGQRTIYLAGMATGALTLAAIAANANGQVQLSAVLGSAVIFSSCIAVVLYTAMRVIEGLIEMAMCLPPVALLGMVQRKQATLLRHIVRWLRWLAYLTWLASSLHVLGMLRPLLTHVEALWETTLTIGTYAPTVGDIISFALILWLTFGLSRLIRFVLEEEAYPKLQLERGLPYAISTMVHYLVLLTGFVLALNALKVDMTKFTILAGALSVGIGFGLQNIVNNFVSGLIVLFERPVKVGDTVQMDDVVGRVKHIGIRATIIASTSGAEVIVPNGKLISEKVTNWTLSSKLRQVLVTVVTKASYDASEIKQLLLAIALRDERVAEKPVPEALFVKRTIDQAEFELHVWTAALDEWLELRSDLMSEINEALRQKELPK